MREVSHLARELGVKRVVRRSGVTPKIIRFWPTGSPVGFFIRFAAREG